MPGTLALRTARPADMAELDALYGRSYPALLKHSYPPSILVTAIPLLAKVQPRLIASGTYFVVTDDLGAIVGAGGWSALEPRSGRGGAPATGHVRHVVTDHKRVRQGIGRALMGHIFDHARAAGMTRLDCLSTLMAVPFYAACGFEEGRHMTLPLQPGIDFRAVFMQRSI